MKLKDYIKEKALFDNINTDDIRKNYKDIKQFLKKSKIDLDTNVFDLFENSIVELEQELDAGNEKLQQEFYSNVQPKNLSRSYDNYEVKKYGKLKKIDDNHWDDELKSLVLTNIKKQINFQFPGLEITPRSDIWTKHMTGMDPFFIASKDLDVVEEVAAQFQEVYKRRVRVYQYEDANFGQLPQETFSFVFSWNYFEYLPYDMIDKYFASIYNLLLPGGIVFISYADCLQAKIAEQFESNYYCYMTKELLEGLANKNGFDLVSDGHYQFRTSWAVIQKPGELPQGIKDTPSLGYLKNVAQEPLP